MTRDEVIEKIEELAAAAYKAGLLHGQGLIDTIQHRQAAERSKELFREITEYLKGKTDAID